MEGEGAEGEGGGAGAAGAPLRAAEWKVRVAAGYSRLQAARCYCCCGGPQLMAHRRRALAGCVFSCD